MPPAASVPAAAEGGRGAGGLAGSLLSLHASRTAQAAGSRPSLVPTRPLDDETLRRAAAADGPAAARTLELRGLALCTLTAALGQCAQLRCLDASCNEVAEVEPAAVKTLTELRELLLASNRISTLAWARAVTPRLHTLSLADNRLQDVSALAAVAGLVRLDVQGNCLRTLRGLGKLAELQQVNASRNQLSVVGEHLKSAHKLTDLCVSRNALTDLAGIDCLTALEDLDLSHNMVVDAAPRGKGAVHRPLQRLQRLERLDLSHNRLRGLSLLPVLPRLTDLLLAHNQLGGEAAEPAQAATPASASQSIFDASIGDAEYGSDDGAPLPPPPPAAASPPARPAAGAAAGPPPAFIQRLPQLCPALELLDIGGNSGALRCYDALAPLSRLTALTELCLAGAVRSGGRKTHREEVLARLPAVAVVDREPVAGGPAFDRVAVTPHAGVAPASAAPSRPNTGGDAPQQQQQRPGTAGQRPASASLPGPRPRGGYSAAADPVRQLEGMMAKLEGMHSKAVGCAAALSRAAAALPPCVDDLPAAAPSVHAALDGEMVPPWRPRTPPPAAAAAAEAATPTPPRAARTGYRRPQPSPGGGDDSGSDPSSDGGSETAIAGMVRQARQEAEGRRASAGRCAGVLRSLADEERCGSVGSLTGSLGGRASFREEAEAAQRRLRHHEQAARDRALYHAVEEDLSRRRRPSPASPPPEAVRCSVATQAGDAAVAGAARGSAAVVSKEAATEDAGVGGEPAMADAGVGGEPATAAPGPDGSAAASDEAASDADVAAGAAEPEAIRFFDAGNERAAPAMETAEAAAPAVVVGGDCRQRTPPQRDGGRRQQQQRAVLGSLQPTDSRAACASLRPSTPSQQPAPVRKVSRKGAAGLSARRKEAPRGARTPAAAGPSPAARPAAGPGRSAAGTPRTPSSTPAAAGAPGQPASAPESCRSADGAAALLALQHGAGLHSSATRTPAQQPRSTTSKVRSLNRKR
eukprot:TRINITY_DN1937_c0_g1_i1.p1 TRINITY_DN1937_c0_g1~~TRINITY_DN1937_c0_g1_i1.p1  ORF type:complete len:1000 (+),score=424.42 TRINITY_DN1937_c0_g1_i1:61-3000(+)